MANLQAAKRYAQAVMELAIEDGSIAAWRADLDDIAQVLTESQAAELLADGRLANEQKFALVDRVLDVRPVARNLAKLLIQKGRSLDARAVAEAFGRMADEREGLAQARVTTAVPLEAAQVAAIEQRLGTSLGLRVTAQATTDPAILGGIVVRVGDKLVDGSIRTRLRRLRRELEHAR